MLQWSGFFYFAMYAGYRYVHDFHGNLDTHEAITEAGAQTPPIVREVSRLLEANTTNGRHATAPFSRCMETLTKSAGATM